MEKWNSKTTEALYKMCNINTLIGIIDDKDHPTYKGYNHYLLPNGLHAYMKPSGGDGIFTYEDITKKYESSKEKIDPNDPYFDEKFPISDVYFERFTVPGTSNKGTQIVIGNGSISFDENGNVFNSHLEIPTTKGGYDTITTQNNTDSIEDIIKKMMDKYKSFNLPENSQKKELYEKALRLYSDIKSLGNSKNITPQDALKNALSSGVSSEVIANIPNIQEGVQTHGER